MSDSPATSGLADEVVAAALEVHGALGPGLVEGYYERCLAHELRLRGIPCRRQVPLPLEFKGWMLGDCYRMDLVVADAVVVELKTVERLLPAHRAQLRTYLSLSGLPVGLLLNFHAEDLREGLERMEGEPVAGQRGEPG